MLDKIKDFINWKTALIVIPIILEAILYIHYKPHKEITTTTGITSPTNIYADTGKKIPGKSNVTYKIITEAYNGTAHEENIFVTSNPKLKDSLLKTFSSDSEDKKSTAKKSEKAVLNSLTVEGQPILTYFDDGFFANNSLAVQVIDKASTQHEYAFVSVTRDDSTGSINIRDKMKKYEEEGTASQNGSYEIRYIILDKNINNVNFNIYRKTVNNKPTLLYYIYVILKYIVAVMLGIIVVVLVFKYVSKKMKKR